MVSSHQGLPYFLMAQWPFLTCLIVCSHSIFPSTTCFNPLGFLGTGFITGMSKFAKTIVQFTAIFFLSLSLPSNHSSWPQDMNGPTDANKSTISSLRNAADVLYSHIPTSVITSQPKDPLHPHTICLNLVLSSFTLTQL